ncbi:hypothetical protein LF1_19030 [Rubripirellula obstinata]|uniref:Uncharacterized protein n=1 Tax=Rubripirellula obstinata TaxID=406547 RepID=A0A5B1CGN7_9BACT|nr:hypothetical protein LF1_19030 [Rubripirellula obstinata]
MWGSHPGARAPGRELPALRAYCAVTDATSRAKGDHKKSYVPNTRFPQPKPFTALGDAHAAKRFRSAARSQVLPGNEFTAGDSSLRQAFAAVDAVQVLER